MSVNDPKRTSGAFDAVAYDGLRLLRLEPRRRPESFGVARARPRSPLVIEPKSGHLHPLQAGNINIAAPGDDAVAKRAAAPVRMFNAETARQARDDCQSADIRAVWRDKNIVT